MSFNWLMLKLKSMCSRHFTATMFPVNPVTLCVDSTELLLGMVLGTSVATTLPKAGKVCVSKNETNFEPPYAFRKRCALTRAIWTSYSIAPKQRWKSVISIQLPSF